MLPGAAVLRLYRERKTEFLLLLDTSRSMDWGEPPKIKLPGNCGALATSAGA
jgi:uncharacterized protein with von Willebrand factor type A (vWA) domain